jgi:hypothetical protein
MGEPMKYEGLIRHHAIHDPTNTMVMLFTVVNEIQDKSLRFDVGVKVFRKVSDFPEEWGTVAHRVVHSETCFLDIPSDGINMDKEDARHLWRYLTGSTKKCVPCWKCMDGMSDDELVRLGMACWKESS